MKEIALQNKFEDQLEVTLLSYPMSERWVPGRLRVQGSVLLHPRCLASSGFEEWGRQVAVVVKLLDLSGIQPTLHHEP